jgi:hypothetical protein
VCALLSGLARRDRQRSFERKRLVTTIDELAHNSQKELRSVTGKDWWTTRRFGCISIALSLAEIAAIGTAIVVVQLSSHRDIPRIQSLAADAWLLGGIGSLGSAVAGLVADLNRFTAFLAIILTVLTFVACGTQFLV